MAEIKKRKTDRRTIYTIQLIKDAFLDLVKIEGYNKISIAKLCRQAEITRSTFYLHYNTITDVLNDVLDDAILSTDLTSNPAPTNEELSFDYLKKNESLLPACQRVGDSEKYQLLLLDPDLSEYIIGRIMAHERNYVIPSIMKKAGLSQEDTETLFLYIIHGSFAVNRAHHFIKDKKWAHDVQLLNRFTEAGYKYLKNDQSK
ncbi:hypothetical protein GCM10022297_12790 [Lactobacillus hamsteri]|uniref:HTH tetR-type domain-containing protein n=1 Tax=Lactobacillus hamsteri DSM 5661 = JCM 6256 TaxID=1423754 RepID=A0A0R1YL74_9LACO|nr:TetR/AcrR family transcriptional regulator [Lactobacillus hamsteri]KRM40601.1 hypothetical protein FC39_GL000417 [Lactobacillus hamsteri DSM 5661 = JCM 6256]